MVSAPEAPAVPDAMRYCETTRPVDPVRHMPVHTVAAWFRWRKDAVHNGRSAADPDTEYPAFSVPAAFFCDQLSSDILEYLPGQKSAQRWSSISSEPSPSAIPQPCRLVIAST